MSLFTHSILSIDGGGIRGVIPCIVLMEIEERTGKSIAELFDLMAGTSTGGMLAAGLNLVNKEGKIKNKAQDLLDLYKKQGSEIFKKALPGGLNALRLLVRSQFSKNGIEGVLKGEFGDAMLSEGHTELLITSYNPDDKKPFYFLSRLAKTDPEEDFPIFDVTRSTSAAPTYFPPHPVFYKKKLHGEPVGLMGLVDGGVFANNPSVLAYVETLQTIKRAQEEAQKKAAATQEEAPEGVGTKGMTAVVGSDNNAAPILLLSIGTGATQKPYLFKYTRGWGVKWLRPLIDIFMQGVSESVHYQMQHLLPSYINSEGKEVKRYYRLNIEIDKEYSDMADASKTNIDQLVKYGQEIVKKHDKEIDFICKQLKIIAKLRKKRS